MRNLYKNFGLLILAVVVWLAVRTEAQAQKPPVLLPPNPQAPVLAMPSIMGMQRGTTLELTLTGSNLAGPTGVLSSFLGKITIPTDNKNGMDNAKLRVRLEVPADAPIGYHTLRLSTTRGISNLRLFCIDDLPQVQEVDTNRNKATPQVVPVPCVVDGRVDNEQADFYKISVKAGQRLTLDVLGRRLGGTLDPEIYVYEAKSLRELAHQNDSPGCQTDARLTYTFKDAGEYLIEVRDVLNRGGPDYPYRLRIGDFPNATVPLPMAAKRGSKIAVQFAGPQVDGVAPVALAVPTDPALSAVWVAPKGPSGLHGWPVALALSDHEQVVEQEPNNEPAKAQVIPMPGGVTGRFQQSDDLDIYRFTAKKGQKILIAVETLELYSPSLVLLALKNAKTGAPMGQSNPQAAPPADQRIEFTAPDDGDYLVEVQHLNLVGGPSEAYHLSVAPVDPGFELTVGLDRFDLAPDSFVPLTVQANRKGYAGPIDLSVVGHPGLTGTAIIPPGQASTLLLVNAKGDLPKGPYQVTVMGKGLVDAKPVVRFVNVRPSISQALNNLPYPPLHLFNHIALAVRDQAPFKLVAKIEPTEHLVTGKVSLTILAQRNPGFDDVIALTLPTGLPPNVPAPKIPPIAKGQNQVKVDLALNPKAPLGTYQIMVSGTGKGILAHSTPAPLVLTLPFELKAEPAVLKLSQGSKDKVRITATRKAGYQGPIAVDLRKLPAGVTATKGVIPMGQSTIELEVTAAPTAPAATQPAVDAIGTATAAGNQQAASPPFTVLIAKK
jgi:hypothetical protein